MVSKEIKGDNLDDGFTFEVKPHKSGNSVVITIPQELFKSNQINVEQNLKVNIRSLINTSHKGSQD